MPSLQEGWRGTTSWEGTQPGELTQTGQRDIPYHTMTCPVYKLGGAGWGGRIAARELTGHRCASLDLYYLYLYLILLVLLLSFYYYYDYHYQYFLSFLSY